MSQRSLDLEKSILEIRAKRIMIDSDLARLYGVSTKRMNEQVKRNQARFPADFMFQLTQAEKDEVVANCDHLRNIKFSHVLPHAFTEHGALMLASVLSSPIAIDASIEVIRAFIRLRELLGLDRAFAAKFKEIERKFSNHDNNFKIVFEAIRQIMAPDLTGSKKQIGIRPK